MAAREPALDAGLARSQLCSKLVRTVITTRKVKINPNNNGNNSFI